MLLVKISRMKGNENPHYFIAENNKNIGLIFKLPNALSNQTDFSRVQARRYLESEYLLNRHFNQLQHEDIVKIQTLTVYYISLFLKMHLLNFYQILALFMSRAPVLVCGISRLQSTKKDPQQSCENSMSGVIHHCVRLAGTLSQ